MAKLPTLSDLQDQPDTIAPDGSEIRFLESPPSVATRPSMVHATLRPGTTTQAVQHRTVEESWICVGGKGELWRATGETESIIKLHSGIECEIPLGTRFQFRSSADSDAPLEIVITTTPPWPGDHEAFKVEGKWTPTV